MNKDNLPEEYKDTDSIEPTPRAYGFPENPMPYQVQVWNRQELFLAAYARTGKRSKAAKEAGITVWCVEKWVAADVYGIRKRMEQAHREYVESLEAEMDAAIKSRPVATQLLQIFRLKAEAPEKYREEVKVVGMEASKQMMDKLRELASKELKNREAQEALEAQEAKVLPAPAIEAVFQDITPRQEPQAGTPSPRTDAPRAAPQYQPRESAKDRRAAQVKAVWAARREPTRRVTRR
jgi:hypothetical protein